MDKTAIIDVVDALFDVLLSKTEKNLFLHSTVQMLKFVVDSQLEAIIQMILANLATKAALKQQGTMQ